MSNVINSLLFQPPPATYLHPSRHFWLTTRLGNRIPAFFIERPNAIVTILFSHGNAEDLGMIYDWFNDLARVLKVNIMAYDYTGYGKSVMAGNNGGGGGLAGMGNSSRSDGASQGSHGTHNTGTSASNSMRASSVGGSSGSGRPIVPSEDNCYADIESAYQYLLEVRKLQPEQIVLYGRSLGSGPSCYLASKTAREGRSVGGVILQSPLLSAFRVAFNFRFTMFGDKFPNIDYAPHIRCPVFIIHGTQDEVVPFWHGEDLFMSLPQPWRAKPFWVEGAGHNNIEALLRPTGAFLEKLTEFLEMHVSAKRGIISPPIMVPECVPLALKRDYGNGNHHHSSTTPHNHHHNHNTNSSDQYNPTNHHHSRPRWNNQQSHINVIRKKRGDYDTYTSVSTNSTLQVKPGHDMDSVSVSTGSAATAVR